jgi:hypothetical protein
MILPTQEQCVRRARTLLRLIWQAYDAAGHSNGRSRTCAMLELSMSLIGTPDPSESNQADNDPRPLIDEAKDWMHDLNAEKFAAEAAFFGREAAEMGLPELPAIPAIMTGEIECGFENRMR